MFLNKEMSNITSQATSVSKKAVKATARSISDQSLETLKVARTQATGNYEKTPSIPAQGSSDQVASALRDSEITPQEQERIKIEKTKKLKMLEEEMDGYRKAREEKDKQLKEQEELEKRQAEEKKAQAQDLIEPASKKSRGLMPGMKGKLSRMKRKTEMRQPPSG